MKNQLFPAFCNLFYGLLNKHSLIFFRKHHSKFCSQVCFVFFISIFCISINKAQAETEIKFYSGIDLQYRSIKLGNNRVVLSDGTIINDIVDEQYPHEIMMPNLFLGFDNNKSLKLELGYSKGENSSSNSSTGIGANASGNLGKYSTKTYPYQLNTVNKIKTETLSFDFKPYSKLDELTSLYGIIGLSYNKISVVEKSSVNIKGVERKESYSTQTSIISPSIGVGFEFEIYKSIFSRVQVKYNFLNKELKTSGLAGKIKLHSFTNANFGIGFYF